MEKENLSDCHVILNAEPFAKRQRTHPGTNASAKER